MGLIDNAGPLLIRAGLITREQLRVALDAMRQGGGTLPEQLALRHILEEERLCQFFSDRLMVPRVGQPELSHVPPTVIQLLPGDMAGEFRVVPFQIDGDRNLQLAMMDPSDTHAIDEVAFFSGLSVMRFVAPPRAIAWALGRYYDIVTPLAREAAASAVAARAGADAKRRLPPAEIVDPVYDVDTPLPIPIPFDTTGNVIRVDPASGAHALPRSMSPEADQALEQTARELGEVGDRDALYGVLVSYLRRLCRRSALFLIRRGELCGWLGSGVGIHIDALREAILPLDRPSTFRDIVRSRLPFRGPVTDVASRDFLIESLGWAPVDMLAVPISIGERVIGILYGDERTLPLPDEHLAHLVRQAEAALTRMR